MPTRRSYSKSPNRTTSYRRPTNKRKSTTRKTEPWMTSSRTAKWNPTTWSCNAPAFNPPRHECKWRIGSYRTIYAQFSGAGLNTAFSPANAKKWVKFINNGYRVFKFTNKDFCRHFGNQWATATPTSCHKWMKQKYGASIKAVTRGKANCWLIATTPSVTGRPFNTYNWK